MNTFEEVARMVGVSAALTTGLTLLVGVAYKAGRFIYKSMKYAEHAHDTISRVDELLERQLTNNGGSSLLDKVESIRDMVIDHHDRLIKIEATMQQPLITAVAVGPAGAQGERGETGEAGADGADSPVSQ